MLLTQGTVQAAEHARVAVMLIAVGIVVFWRTALRVLLAIMVVAIVAGGLMLLQSLHM